VQEVTDTFNAVHDYLATNPPVTGSGGSHRIGSIALGDYIDLPTLTIISPQTQKAITIENTAITYWQPPFAGYEGRLLRLIVVGINSFQGPTDSIIAITLNGGAPTHLVFQFQNIPDLIRQRMNSGTITNEGGYAESMMRRFYILTDFLTGLKAATGLTDSLLWAPVRKVSKGGNPEVGTDTITDALWLPTEWEMFGERIHSSQEYEVDAGQARLEYYQTAAERIKYDTETSPGWYWTASPKSGSAQSFCLIYSDGLGVYQSSNAMRCVAPAFCVK
jgi:hypothetical protein